MPDLSTSIVNTGPDAVAIDAVYLRSKTGQLSAENWRSVADWAAVDPTAATAALGKGALSFGEVIAAPDSLVELNLAGAGVWAPGASVDIGRPLLGSQADAPGNVEFYFRRALPNAPQEAGVLELTPDASTPTVAFAPVPPDQTLLPIDSVRFAFSEPVQGFDLADLKWLRNGVSLPLPATAQLSTADQKEFELSGLGTSQSKPGEYSLELRSVGAQIVDEEGFALLAGVRADWQLYGALNASISSVPSPRRDAVSSVQIAFTEPVSGFDLADLSLVRDGGANLLTGSESLTTSDHKLWTLSGLGLLTEFEGVYQLSLAASSSGIRDGVGRELAADASTQWTSDFTPPTADIIDVTPDPRINSPAQVRIVFSEDIAGLSTNNFSLRTSLGNNWTSLQTTSATLLKVDARTYVLSKLPYYSFPGEQTITLTLRASSRVADLAGNLMVDDASDVWTEDITPPSGWFLPDPNWNPPDPLPWIDISFSEPVNGLRVSDFSLMLNGRRPNLLTDAQTLTKINSTTWRLDHLDAITAEDGTYQLWIENRGQIVDRLGTPMQGALYYFWTLDRVPPTVEVIGVQPDPHPGAIDSLQVRFSEPIMNFGIEDLRLSRDGGGNLLLGSEQLFNVDGRTWQITGLADSTSLPGEYTFSVIAEGVTDFYAHPLVAGASDTWSVTPTVELASPPSSTNQPVASVEIDFDAAVAGFDLADLKLTRDGVPVPLSTAQLLTADRKHWRLENLWELTRTSGNYRLELTAAGSGIVAGNAVPLLEGDVSLWTLDRERPTVTDIRFTTGLGGGSPNRVIVELSETVSGAPLPGMSLSRDGGPNLLVGQSNAAFHGRVLTFSGLEEELAEPGNYVFRVDAAATELRDAFGNRLEADAQKTWHKQATMVLQVAADGSAWLINRSDSELFIDGYLIRSTGGQLDPLGWRSIADWVAEDLEAVTAALGAKAAAFGETPPTSAALAELNLSGGGIWSPGESIALGKPFSGLSTNIPVQSSFFYHVVGIEASQVGSIELVLPSQGLAAQIEAVSPDPAYAPLTQLQISFSEAVSGFGLEDLRLSRDGIAVGWRSQTLTSPDQKTWTLGGLEQLTAGDGQYELFLSSFGSQIVDHMGRPLVADALETWRIDVTKPTGQWSGVDASQSGPIDSVRLDFSEPVEGLERADLELTLPGGANLLGSGQTLRTLDGRHWVLSGLAPLTAGEGKYKLRLNTTQGVRDLRGNELAQAAELNFDIDRTGPTVAFGEVQNPNQLPERIEIRFSEPVDGLKLKDFQVAINDQPLRPLQAGTLERIDPKTWALTHLAGFPFMFSGDIRLEITPARGVLQDAAGNLLATGASVTWTLDLTPPTAEFVSPVDWNKLLPMPVAYLSFSEPIRGLELQALDLQRAGETVRMTSSQFLTQVSPTVWRIDNLTAITAPDGYYTLQLRAGSGVTDLVGNSVPFAKSLGWMHDGTAPTATIKPVSPDPRNGPVERIEFTISPDVYVWSVDGADLTLIRNGISIPLKNQVVIQSLNVFTGSFVVHLPASMTSGPGAYEFIVGGETSDLADNAGNRLVKPAVERWLRGFAVQVKELSPKMRTRPVDTLTIEFNEPVEGFGLASLTLARDDGANLLTAAQTLTTSDRRVWTLGNLAGLTSVDGDYQLNVSNLNVTNSAGTLLPSGARETWSLDASVPTVTVDPVSPAVRTSLESLSLTLSEPIPGFGLLNLQLTRNGQLVDLYRGPTSRLTSADGLHWTLRLAGLSMPEGVYELRVIDLGLADAAGNRLSGAATRWTISSDPSQYHADFNSDGHIDLTDFDLLKTHFGMRNLTRAQGDADGDGDIDLFDFGVLKARFGSAPPAAAERYGEAAADAVFGKWR